MGLAGQSVWQILNSNKRVFQEPGPKPTCDRHSKGSCNMDPAEETEKGPSEETSKAHRFLKPVKSLLHSSENRTEVPQVGDN